MKNLYLLLAVASLFINSTPKAQVKTKVLKKVTSLIMPRTAADDMPGRRGAAVVWHPKQKKYYAAMAGNAGYPIATFEVTGKLLSDKDALIDVRGLWYNPEKNTIEGNGYNDNGWFNYETDEEGMITDVDVLFEDMKQPGEQSVGAYNYRDKKVMFLDDSKIIFYGITNAEVDGELSLHWGRSEKEGASDYEDVPEGYNRTTVIYSEIPGAEIGVLNINKMQVELYDIKNGFLTRVLTLPSNANAEASFNFAWSNGIVWLFDMDGRTWNGYK